jgi:ubiquitin-conjugating enzyme E2 W
MELVKNPTPGVIIDAEKIETNINEWNVTILGAEGTIYQGETFELQFLFNDKYPFDSPSVVFIGKNIPEHSHIYSNGHICLSILSQDWTPGERANLFFEKNMKLMQVSRLLQPCQLAPYAYQFDLC